MKYRAVIFDLFGTLTYHTSHRAYRDVVLSMASSLEAHGEDLVRLWLDSGDIRVGGQIGTMEAYLRYNSLISLSQLEVPLHFSTRQLSNTMCSTAAMTTATW